MPPRDRHRAKRPANGWNFRSAEIGFRRFAVNVSVLPNHGPRIGAVFPAVVLWVPLCSQCARNWKVRMCLIGLATFGAVIGATLLLLLSLALDQLAFWVVFALVCGVTPLVAAGVAYRLTTPVRVQTVDASRGIVRLRFRSEEYRNNLSVMAGVRG